MLLSSDLSSDVPSPSSEMYGEEIPSSYFGKVNFETDVKNEWDFELTGWPVCEAREDELPLDYAVPGAIYIRIKSYDTNDSELIQFTFYRFYIYRNGFENINGYLSNEIGYSDPTDCLEAAILFVKNNWETVITSYSDNMNETLNNSDIRVEDLERYMNNSFSFIPDLYELRNGKKFKFHNCKEVTFKL